MPGAGGVVDFPGIVGGAVEDVEADVFGFDAGFNHASYVAVAEPAYEAAGVRSGTVVGTRSAETDADDADAVVFVEVATEGFAEYLADGVGAVGSVGHVVGDEGDGGRVEVAVVAFGDGGVGLVALVHADDVHGAKEDDAADACLLCCLEDVGGGDYVVGHEQVPADVGGVARLGSEMHYDVFALECGGDGFEVGEVGGEGVQAFEGNAVDAAELVLVAEVVAQDFAYSAAESGYQDFLLVGHSFLQCQMMGVSYHLRTRARTGANRMGGFLPLH